MINVRDYRKVSDLLHAEFERCPTLNLKLCSYLRVRERAILSHGRIIQQRRVVKFALDGKVESCRQGKLACRLRLFGF
jgi:hypothetical protein